MSTISESGGVEGPPPSDSRHADRADDRPGARNPDPAAPRPTPAASRRRRRARRRRRRRSRRPIATTPDEPTIQSTGGVEAPPPGSPVTPLPEGGGVEGPPATTPPAQ